MSTPRATVREVNGQIVLDDPDALAMARVIAKHNCRGLFDENLERIEHFKRRVDELGFEARAVCIAILNVDDPNGGLLARELMPGQDWQAIRDRGLVPIARGIVYRWPPLIEVVSGFDREAGEALREFSGLAVLVVDHGVAQVFPA